MLVGPDGTAVGSVSGGCVEGAVYELAQSVVASGVPVPQRYGVSDDDAFTVGLTCGGIIDLFVEPISASVRTDSSGSQSSPSAGMQYEQRRLHRSVSDTRRSVAVRP
jgi:xanthine dehydrogenase accessory factor